MINGFKKVVELEDWLDEESANADLLSDIDKGTSYTTASESKVDVTEDASAETSNDEVSE